MTVLHLNQTTAARWSFVILIRRTLFATTRFALTALAAAAIVAPTAAAHAQVTATDKVLSKIDLAVSGEGIFNRSVSGPVIATYSSNTGAIVSDSASNTLGALVTLRYIRSSYVGLEANYSYARYTENYSNIGGVQTQANEYSLGYVATPAHDFFGFKPFISAGLGATEFKPTPRGGQGLLKQAATTYYYSAGVQQEYFSSHFGLRASFRQAFFLAPDFYQNYLTINRHTSIIEPTIGFYLRF